MAFLSARSAMRAQACAPPARVSASTALHAGLQTATQQQARAYSQVQLRMHPRPPQLRCYVNCVPRVSVRAFSAPVHPNGEPHAVLSSASAGAEDDGIRTLTLNRPAARNAISRRMLDELLEAVKQVRFDRQARALIIRTSAPGVAFCAGADLKERRKFSPAQVDVFLADLRTAFSGIERLPVPTIAAIDGLAMGGGMELALCADLRIASEDVKGLGLTETKLGIIPGAGGTQRMTRLLGPSRTKDLIYTARLLTAAQAHNLGLVDYLASANSDNNSDDVQCGSAYNKALEIAQQIAKNGPLAVRAAKLAIDKGQAMDTETGLDFERACYNTVMHTKDRLEGLKAFAEKRAPKYIGE